MNDESDGTLHSVVGTSPNATFIMTNALAGTAPPGTPLTPPIKFTTAGTFTYDCGIHGPEMSGQITVQ
jgi:plastocyanin